MCEDCEHTEEDCGCDGCAPCGQPQAEPCVGCESPCVDETSEVVLVASQDDCEQPCCVDDEITTPCRLRIAAIIDLGTTVRIEVTGAGGVVEYSNDNDTWQESNVFTSAPQSTTTYYVREKARVLCSAQRTYSKYCTSDWEDVIPAVYQCSGGIRQKKQKDGCGNEQWIDDDSAWTDTEETRCV